MYCRQTSYCHGMYNIFVDWSCEVKQNCALLKIKSVRRTMLKLRGGEQQLFRLKWEDGMERGGRICKECGSGEVDDVCHWLVQCFIWDHLRENQQISGSHEVKYWKTSHKRMTEIEQP